MQSGKKQLIRQLKEHKPMTHTPGPWKTQKSGDFQPWKVLLPDGIAIAVFKYSAKEPSDTQEANARLIAAAPMMLEALKKHGIHVAYCQSDDPTLKSKCAVCDVIASAEGRE